MTPLARRALSAFFGLLLLLGAGYAPAHANPGKPEISASLLLGDLSADAKTLWVGVRVRLGPEWKTYWKSPGDSGLPPEFDWSGSDNIARVDVNWPAPRRLSLLGVETIGYRDEVVFPARVQLVDPNRSTSIKLALVIYACSTICVRDEHRIEARIESGNVHSSSQKLIDEWRDKVPSGSLPGLKVASIERAMTGPASLSIKLRTTAPADTVDAFLDGDPPLTGQRPRVLNLPDGMLSLTVQIPERDAESLRRQEIRATVIAGKSAIVAVSPAEDAGQTEVASAPQNGKTLLAVLASALLGGFILNLMPCVFPVLALKLFTVVNTDRKRVRSGFVVSAAGIITSFVVLAGALSAAKAAGASVGWGIQFQQPWFLIAMIAVLGAFSASLFDLVHIRIPSRLATRLAGRASGSSLISQFLSGFVATLLATPCSAPFVGTAVAFSLSRGTSETLLVFGGLGIGMSFPYLLLAAFPALSRLAPKPGPWLSTVKQGMAIALLVTAAWLLVVLGSVGGWNMTIIVAGAGAAVFLVLEMVKARSRRVLAAQAFAIALAIATVALSATTPPSNPSIAWRPFGAAEIPGLVQSGRTIFVDITADWCVTCKVNKALVIDTPAVTESLRRDVLPMQANWTRPNETIAQFMQRYGRYGLPFNIVFGPGAPDGIVLPELLTQSALMAAFDTAAGNTPSQPH